MNNVFLLTGISNKNPTGTGILPKFQVGNGIGTPPSGPSKNKHQICQNFNYTRVMKSFACFFSVSTLTILGISNLEVFALE